MSQAMFRVSRALALNAPADISIVTDRYKADFEVAHVIGLDALTYKPTQAKKFAVIQYCGGSFPGETWAPLWERSAFVWSYYDLTTKVPEGVPFYHAPLGVDGHQFDVVPSPRTVGILTSGYVTGPGAEAIEEAVLAAQQLGLPAYHLGPVPVLASDQSQKMVVRPNLTILHGIPDSELARAYSQCLWVSGLRHDEGFEMPVIEGLACGARPIVFDRPEMRHWYGKHAVFVPECHGGFLIELLLEVMRTPPVPVSPAERATVLKTFNWQTIAAGFWAHVKEAA